MKFAWWAPVPRRHHSSLHPIWKRKSKCSPGIELLEDRKVPTITNVPVAVSLPEGVTSTVIVAEFTDTDNVTTANFTKVSINWGDGSAASAGTINGVGGAGATYFITGSHSYADEGSQSVTVSLHDTMNNTDLTLPANAVTIMDAPLSPGTKVTPGSPQAFSGTGGTSTSGGSFTALQAFQKAIGGSDNGATASAQSTGYRTINWDDVKLDGTDFSGASTTIKANTTVAIPTNRYQERATQFAASYAVSIDSGSGSFTDVNPNVSSLFASFSAKNTVTSFNNNVIGVTFVLASNHTTTPSAGATKGFGAIFRNVEVANSTSIEYFNGGTSLGKFFAPASTTKGDAVFLGELFSSSIVTSVQITLGQGAVFSFNGTTAISGGSDNPAALQNLVAADDFVFAEPAKISNVSSTTITPTQGTAFTGALATFTDANANATLKDFTATIKWGDGHSSTGTLVQNKEGSFTVSGTNTYSSSGTFTIQVSIADFGGSTTTLSETALVGSSSPGTTVASGTANQNFVNQVFLDLLGRAADVSGLGYWSTLLDQGGSRQTVLNGIQGSTEFRQILVQSLYKHYLKRSADASGLSSFQAFFQQGGTVAQAASILVSSAEYFQVRGGNTNNGWLTVLYSDVLGRAIDSNGSASFGGALAAGQSLAQVAAAIVGSAESHSHSVDVYFQDYLRRHSDSSGNGSWAAVLQRPSVGGIPPEMQIVAGLLTSTEYVNSVQARFPLKTSVPSDPFASSLP